MEKVVNLIKSSDMVVPTILFNNYKKLNISNDELIIIIYLINESNLEYNPQSISYSLDIPVNDILETISNLVANGIIDLNVEVEGRIHKEFISLDSLYKKLAFLVVNEDVEEEINNNVFDVFEKEFGRPLSPIEFELINGWQSAGISEELTLLALKEAVYNGALSLRYIDRILFDWSKKGIKNASDVEKSKQKFKEDNEPTELFDYDWLNDNEKG